MSNKIKLYPVNSKLSFKEISLYSLSGFGQNIICTLMSTYILIFYTDVFGISAMAAAVIMFSARVFDAFNDPVMGSIVDKTRTKWGKLRPYMLFTPLPIALLTVFSFASPELSAMGKVAYAAVCYVLWGLVYTVIDVPYWGLSAAMTSDTNERNKLLSIARLVATAGGGLLTLVVPQITGYVTNQVKVDFAIKHGNALDALLKAELNLAVQNALKPTYFWIAVISTLVAAPMFILAFIGTKERVVVSEKTPSLKHNLSLLLRNRPLLLIVASCILGSLQIVYASMFLYLAKYNFGNESYATYMTIMATPLGILASVFMPYLSRKLGKKNLYIWLHLFQAAVLAGMYFIGYDSTAKIICLALGLILLGLPSGLNNILTYALIGDTVDYLELKTEERAEGICFSMQTFISKISMAFGSLAIGITLGAIFYVPNDFSPDKKVLNGLFFLATMGAAVSSMLCVIPMLFYNFTESEQAEARRVIDTRNKF